MQIRRSKFKQSFLMFLILINALARGDRDSGSGGEFILSRGSAKYAQFSKDCPNSIVSTGIVI